MEVKAKEEEKTDTTMGPRIQYLMALHKTKFREKTEHTVSVLKPRETVPQSTYQVLLQTVLCLNLDQETSHTIDGIQYLTNSIK